MKESVITGERQKESLSANNYFGGKRTEGRAWEGGTIQIKMFFFFVFFPGQLCVPYHIHILVM